MVWVPVNDAITTVSSSSTPSITITEPAQDTLMLCAIDARDAASVADPTVSSFTGWTQVTNGAVSLSSGADHSMFLYYRIAPASFGTTINTLTLDRNCNVVMAYANFSGNDTTQTNATGVSDENTSSVTSQTVGAITPVLGDELVIYVIGVQNEPGGTSPYFTFGSGTLIDGDLHGTTNALGWAYEIATDTSAYDSLASWTTARQCLEIAAHFDIEVAGAPTTQIASYGLDHRPKLLYSGTNSKSPESGGAGNVHSSLGLDMDIRI